MITIIVPCFNEIDTVKKIIDALIELRIKKEIIIVDDGSTDGTRELVQKLYGRSSSVKIRFHKTNCGKGAAIQTGLQNSAGDVVIIQDADLEYNPEDILRVTKPILQKKCDAVFGSRFLFSDPPKNMDQPHVLANKILTFFTNIISRQKLTDVMTCYKAFSRVVADRLSLSEKGFNVEPEIAIKIKKMRYNIEEIPVAYYARSVKQGKKIRAVDGVRSILSILKWGILWQPLGKKV